MTRFRVQAMKDLMGSPTGPELLFSGFLEESDMVGLIINLEKRHQFCHECIALKNLYRFYHLS